MGTEASPSARRWPRWLRQRLWHKPRLAEEEEGDGGPPCNWYMANLALPLRPPPPASFLFYTKLESDAQLTQRDLSFPKRFSSTCLFTFVRSSASATGLGWAYAVNTDDASPWPDGHPRHRYARGDTRVSGTAGLMLLRIVGTVWVAGMGRTDVRGSCVSEAGTSWWELWGGCPGGKGYVEQDLNPTRCCTGPVQQFKRAGGDLPATLVSCASGRNVPSRLVFHGFVNLEA